MAYDKFDHYHHGRKRCYWLGHLDDEHNYGCIHCGMPYWARDEGNVPKLCDRWRDLKFRIEQKYYNAIKPRFISKCSSCDVVIRRFGRKVGDHDESKCMPF